MTPPTRPRLGRHTGLVSRNNIFVTELGIEIDELDLYEIIRKRVLFEYVVLLTYHQEVGWILVTIMGLIAVGLFIAAAIVQETLGVILALLALVIAAAAVLRIKRKIAVVTIFGRRSKAALRYFWRKERAREVHDLLATHIRAAQEALAHELGPEEIAPAIVATEPFGAPPAAIEQPPEEPANLEL